MRLKDKVAVITGGASGIGLSAARTFASEGARVVLVDRDEAALGRAAQAIGPAVALILPGDVGEEADVLAHAAAIDRALGPPDVLLTAAGWSTGLRAADCDLASWEAVLKTNLTGTFLWARETVNRMTATGRGGSLVFVSSQVAFAGARGNAAYVAAKGAVVSLARSMANDHAADSVRVNVLVPGAVQTPLLEESFARNPAPDAARARSLSRHPLGRLGRADEVARAALFLASEDSSFTTGSCLMVDGGWLAG
ncbi:short-chain dehydrogenase [Acuticoccus sediminis]|uniref:Short-chain dehydrogenase n=1 Tax=Acuticoccus sediminis TaxID=2184697 RepID=A0A8B2NWN4_9HYPH|nr:SDR family oxidoreductase [Acuticoccus sediminis]RAI00107.1 short-chain dehydrogenase [Acuticoccus sediminis]